MTVLAPGMAVAMGRSLREGLFIFWEGYQRDPVYGMQVRIADAPARSRFEARTVWFCSAHTCRERFNADADISADPG